MPLLSVIVPVYNVAPYLGECLTSLLFQEGDVEVIAVNDGSTDGCEKILSEYQKKYPRLIVLHKENGGLSDARNFGLQRATGEYVTFVDSDDVVKENFIQEITNLVTQKETDLVLFDYEFFYPSGKTVPTRSAKFDAPMKKKLLLSSPMAWLRVYKRSLLGDAPFRKGIYYEDLEMTPRMTLKAEHPFYLEKVLYRYRQREGSIMTGGDPLHDRDIFRVLSSLEKAFSEEGETYHSEIEFLFIEHLLRSAALRFASKEKKEYFLDLSKTVTDRFPNWKKNPYLAASSLFFRTVVFFSAKKMQWAVALLKKIRG